MYLHISKFVTLKQVTILIIVIFLGSVSPAQDRAFISSDPGKYYSAKTFYYSIGQTRVPVKAEQFGQSTKFVFINLHDDETTSVAAARKLLEQEGGLLIRIENRMKRNIRFMLKGKKFTIDPNRIFSRQGIEDFMKSAGCYHPAAVDEVENFARRFLQLIPGKPDCIIALHNNTDGFFSVKDYLPGQKRASDAADVFYNPAQDPDDLFITTDVVLYYHLIDKKYNTVLQDNENCRRDGSLSVYAGEQNLRYVNLETQHGKLSQYAEMLNYLYKILTTKNLNVLEYRFILQPYDKTFLPESGSEIYFGNKPVGKILSTRLEEENNLISGILQINTTFPLFSNMIFYLATDDNDKIRLEIKTDPALRSEKLKPSERIIQIRTKQEAEEGFD